MTRTIEEALNQFTLIGGAGSEESRQACAMTLLAWVAGREWTDSPACAHPVIRAAVIRVNDASDTTPGMRREIVRAGRDGILDTWWVPTQVVALAFALEGKDEQVTEFDRLMRALARVAGWKVDRGLPPDLAGANLSGVNLTGADLTYARLAGVNLTRADLTDAFLTRASLTDANLTGANLTRVNLTGANLADADLTRARLADAFLTRASLTDAFLTRASLTDANLTGANLTDANLADADLTRARLADANLTGANLASADLTGVNLTDANLTGANLTGAYGTPAGGMPPGWKQDAGGRWQQDVWGGG